MVGSAAAKRGVSQATDAPPDQQAASAGVSFTALHRSRMFQWAPAPVVAIAACPGMPMVAVGYESGDLELWDLGIMACVQRVAGESIEVTSLAWSCDSVSKHWRTFASHLDGSISEVDWASASLAGTLDSGGGVTWAIAARPLEAVKPGFPHHLAAVCDDGSVRLLAVEDGEPGAQMERVLTVLQGRLLSCAWHPSGDVLVVGGVMGMIHVLETTAGRELVRITVGSSSLAAAHVWRLLVLPDGTLVSGDSEGAVQMWEPAFGTLLQRFQRHKADVLALAAAPDGSAVFASGVDSQVALFEVAPADAQVGGWAFMDYKRPHTHDVRAMDVVRLKCGRAVLVSGGLDAQLVAYPVESFLEQHPVRLSKAPQRPTCQLAAAAAAAGGAAGPVPRLLCCHNETCDVWQVGRHAPVRHVSGAMWSWRQQQQPQPAEGCPVDLNAGPRHLAQIKLGAGARVACAAIAPDGTFMACCSGRGTVRLYQLSSPAPAAQEGGAAAAPPPADPRPSVRRVRMPAGTGRACALALTQRFLVAAHPDGALSCFALPREPAPSRAKDAEAGEEDDDEAEVPVRLVAQAPAPEGLRQQTHGTSWRQYLTPVSVLAASRDGSMLAAAGAMTVTLIHLPSEEQEQKRTPEDAPRTLQRVSKLFRTPHDAPIAGMDFSPDGRLLAAAHADGHLAVYDLQTFRPLQWCTDNETATTRCLDKLPGALIGCAFNPDPEVQQLVVYGPGGFCHFDLTKPLDTTHMDAKRQRANRKLQKLGADAERQGVEEARGRNGRAVLLPDPCVFASYLSVDSLVVLEKPWEEVARAFAPPLLRHRFGA